MSQNRAFSLIFLVFDAGCEQNAGIRLFWISFQAYLNRHHPMPSCSSGNSFWTVKISCRFILTKREEWTVFLQDNLPKKTAKEFGRLKGVIKGILQYAEDHLLISYSYDDVIRRVRATKHINSVQD